MTPNRIASLADQPTDPIGRPAAAQGPPQVTGPDTDPGGGPPPSELGHYQITGILGRGGMGVVFRACDPVLDREVAVKVIKPELIASTGADRHVSRFLAEAKTVAAIRHPNVVPVYEVGEHDGRPFLAMEYCPGGTLADRLTGPLDSRSAAELVAKIARGVEAVHKEEIVHRDLKPGNVLFDVDGEPKVSDFGLAKRVGGPTVTHVPGAVGTPAYMAPEQVWGQRERIGPATDVWALGVILYEALAGCRPFEGDTPLMLMNQIASQEPAPLRSVVPQTPRDLELICHKCLQTDARNRYASAGQVADDLERFLNGQTVSARPVGSWVVARRWSRRNPLAAGLLALSTVLLVGGLAGMTVLWERADRQRIAAERQGAAADRNRAAADAARQDARDALIFQQDLFHAADPFGFSRPGFLPAPGGAKDVTARDLLDRGAQAVGQRPLSPLSRAAILHSIGHAYRGVGETTKAEPLLLEALAIRRDLLGERHEDTIATLMAVGLLRHMQFQTDESILLFREARAHSLALFPEHDPRIGDANFYLAYALIMQIGPHNPHRDEGTVLLDEAARIYRIAGNRRRELTRVQSAQLCLKLFREGRHLDPIAVAKEFQATMDETEKDIVTKVFLKYQFAQWARQAGQKEKAEGLYREVLEIAGRILDPSHILYVATLADYGTLLRDMGRKEQAYEIFSNIHDLLRRHPLRFHPKLTESYTYYGTFLMDLQKWREAEEVLREGLQCAIGNEPARRVLGERLVTVLRELGRAGEADEVNRTVLTAKKN